MKLERKLALVTGGASGLGKATVLHFLRLGMSVAIIDLNPSASLQEELALKYGSKRIRSFKVNISEEDEVKRALEEVKAFFGKGPEAMMALFYVLCRFGKEVFFCKI